MATAPLISSNQIASAIPSASPSELAELPSRVTAIAEGYCCRPLALATYDEELRADDAGAIRLKTWPVTDVAGVYTTPTAVLSFTPIPVPGLWRTTAKLCFDGSDPTIPSGLVLGGSVNGSTTQAIIPFAPTGGSTLSTVSAVAAAVSATTSWIASYSPGWADCPTSEFRAMTGGASGSNSRTSTRSIIAWTGDEAAYDLRPEIGRIQLRGWGMGQSGSAGWSGWAFGGSGFFLRELVRVRYWAGYNGDPTAGPVTVPGNLVEACIQMCKSIIDCRKVSGVIKSISMGNSSVTAAESAAALTPGVITLLNRFVDRRF